MDQCAWMPTPVMGTAGVHELFEKAVDPFSFLGSFCIVIVVE